MDSMLHPRAPSEFVLAPPQFYMAAADELPCDPAILHSFQGLEWMTFVHLQVEVSAINKATLASYRPVEDWLLHMLHSSLVALQAA